MLHQGAESSSSGVTVDRVRKMLALHKFLQRSARNPAVGLQGFKIGSVACRPDSEVVMCLLMLSSLIPSRGKNFLPGDVGLHVSKQDRWCAVQHTPAAMA